MEDKKETAKVHNFCDKCGICSEGGCGYKKHHLCKKIFMLVFILIIFCFGIQIGTLKGELRAMYRYSGVKNSYENNNDRSRMMWGYNQNWQNTGTPLAPSINIPIVQ